MARVIFFGTPEYGVPALRALAAQHEVVAVVTQPDRLVGRGRNRVCQPPVKEAAQSLGIVNILQPQRLRRDPAVLAALRGAEADLFVLAAYGQILPVTVLEMAPHGCIGLHASLLPRWRGSAPIARAIQAGDAETGVTLMLTDAGVDSGGIIAQRRLAIADDDTTGTLTARLAELAAEALMEALPDWLEGRIAARPQPDEGASYAPPVDPAEGEIDWSQGARTIDRQVRAMSPWPGAFTTFDGLRLRLLRAHPDPGWRGAARPGTVIVGPSRASVVTGDGLLVLDELQLAGRRPMDAAQFCRGQRAFAECTLGSR